MFRKYADCHIEGFCRSSIGRVASKHRVGSFDYTPNNDGNYLYVAVRACTGDVPNLNYDMLPSEELKTAYKTFIGSSVFLNHKNDDPEDARGAIVDARWHDEDPDDEWVEILMEMDEDRCPKLCKLIKSGEIDTVSMGANITNTTCSICGNVAEFPFEYCEHVQQKGREFQGRLAYEICNGIDFFECSWVYDPADPTAHTVEMHEDVSERTASKRTFLRKDESGKLAGITRERPHFDSSGKEGVFEDGVRWCETSLWYRQWDDGEMPSSPEDWGEDVTLCDDGSGTLAVIYADDQIAYFEGSDYMYPQGDAIDFSKALGDDDLAREVLVESSRYDENVNGETVDVAKFEERWIIPDVQPKDYC